MSLTNQHAAYEDCYEIWSSAAHLRVGCRTYVGEDFAKAEYLRMRMHHSRRLLRDQSKRAYPREHPLYNQSEYDAFKVTLKQDSDDHWWMYIELHGNWAAAANVEPIPADELEALPPKLPAHTGPVALPTSSFEPATATPTPTERLTYDPQQDDLE